MPRLQGVADFKGGGAVLDQPMHGKSKRPLGFVPLGIEGEPGAVQVAQHLEEIAPYEVGQHEAVMQRRAPAHQPPSLRFAPEPGDQGPDQ